MKYCVRILLCLILAAALTVPVFADVIWEPGGEESPFFDEHRQECRYENNAFLVNSPEGAAVFYDAPNGTPQQEADNGTQIWVSHTWQDWSMVSSSGELYCLWVPTAQLTEVYDYRTFNRDHTPLTDLSKITWGTLDGPDLQLWTYPGSGESLGWGWAGMVENADHPEVALSQIVQECYSAENGLTYGYVSYLYGFRNVYICLDRPCDTDLPIIPVNQELYPAKSAEPAVRPAASAQENYLLPVLLVACTTVLSVALLVIFRKKQKQS